MRPFCPVSFEYPVKALLSYQGLSRKVQLKHRMPFIFPSHVSRGVGTIIKEEGLIAKIDFQMGTYQGEKGGGGRGFNKEGRA